MKIFDMHSPASREISRALARLAAACERPGTAFALAASPLPPGGRFTRGTHVHDSWELKFAVSHGMTVRFPGWSLRLSAPACCLIAPGTPHETSRPADVPRSGLGFVICDDAERFECGPVTALPGQRRIELTTDGLSALGGELGTPPRDFIQSMSVPLRPCAPPAPDEGVRARMTHLLSALSRALPRPHTAGPDSPARLVARAESYLRGRYYDPELTVEDAARAVERTPTHLATLFRRIRNRTVRETLVAIRLAKAREFLGAGLYSVKEVSHLTGWGSPYYFSNTFFAFYARRPSSFFPSRPPHSALQPPVSAPRVDRTRL